MKNWGYVLVCIFLLVFSSCLYQSNNNSRGKHISPFEKVYLTVPKTETEKMLESMQLVDVQSLDSTLLVDLKYAGTDNFTKKQLYKNLKRAYLQPDAARMLVKANQYLHSIRPGMRLLVYDAVRPLCIQREMYESVRNTSLHMYVANPEKTGLHNYGAAVDLTIVDSLGRTLDMGTPFDFFGKAAGINNENELVKQGILSEMQIRNRKILRQAMIQAGFQTIRGEWWHFNVCPLYEAQKRYRLIECF